MKKSLHLSLIGILGLGMTTISFSQTGSNQQLYEQANKQAQLNELLSRQQVLTNKNFNNTESTLMTDSDNDGMPDAWEIANGLNPNDPKDAFADPDNDQVINLFEYQLGGDPNSGATPIKSNISVGQDIATAINNAAANTILRVQSGTYIVQYITFINKKIMIQGGWNSNFTSRNPQTSPTVFDALSAKEVLYFSQTYNNTTDTCSIVLDGLTLINGTATFAALAVIGIYGVWQFSMLDCVVKNCQSLLTSSGAINIFHWRGCKADVTIARTIIANNWNATGIYNQTTDGSIANWRIINVDVSNNRSMNNYQGYGLCSFTSDFATINFNLKNSILWGNQIDGIWIYNNVTADASYSDISSVITMGSAIYNAGSGIINANPLFSDTAAFNYQLITGSPCINTGTNVGFVFAGAAPDMGTYETGLSGINQLTNPEYSGHITIYPNPTNGAFQVSSTRYQLSSIEVFNVLGEKVYNINNLKQKTSKEIDLSNAPKGIYFVKVYDEEKINTEKIVLQ